MARCPSHSDKTPSLCVRDGPDGGLLTHCFAGCPPEQVWAALKARGLVGCRRDNDIPARRRPKVDIDRRRPEVSDKDRRREAWEIWDAARSALHTPVEAYLKTRGICIEPPAAIRYHERLHALIAAVQGPDGRFRGVQRIFLDVADRGYQSKRSLGPIKGGAVRLTPPGVNLQICESLEDGLALLQMTARPTWACLGTTMLAAFGPPPEVRELILAPDHDAAGLEAIEKTVKSAKPSQNATVFRQLLPPPGLDWCNVLEDHDERQAIVDEPVEAAGDRPAPRSWVQEFCDV